MEKGGSAGKGNEGTKGSYKLEGDLAGSKGEIRLKGAPPLW